MLFLHSLDVEGNLVSPDVVPITDPWARRVIIDPKSPEDDDLIPVERMARGIWTDLRLIPNILYRAVDDMSSDVFDGRIPSGFLSEQLTEKRDTWTFRVDEKDGVITFSFRFLFEQSITRYVSNKKHNILWVTQEE